MAVDYLAAHRRGPDPYIGQERASMRTLAEGIACPYCGAGIGSHCVNPRTGVPLSWRLPSHNDRIVTATRGYNGGTNHDRAQGTGTR